MTDPLDDLAADLAAAFPDQHPPADVVAAAKGLLAWRTIDAELAGLVGDSLLDEDLALTRAADRLRQLTFEADGTTIDVELDPAGPERRLVGQLTPPSVAEIEVTGAAGSATADELGRFILPLAPGAAVVGLRVRYPDGRIVVTAPVRL